MYESKRRRFTFLKARGLFVLSLYMGRTWRLPENQKGIEQFAPKLFSNRMKQSPSIYQVITTLLMIAISIISCGGDDEVISEGNNNQQDNNIYFSALDLTDIWVIQSISGENTHTWLKVGNKLTFNPTNGICVTGFFMEDSYKIEDGKIKTFHKASGEPMFVYSLLSQNKENMTVRMQGTLDDKTDITLFIQKLQFVSTIWEAIEKYKGGGSKTFTLTLNSDGTGSFVIKEYLSDATYKETEYNKIIESYTLDKTKNEFYYKFSGK